MRARAVPHVRAPRLPALEDLQSFYLQIRKRDSSIQILGVVNQHNYSNFIFKAINKTGRKQSRIPSLAMSKQSMHSFIETSSVIEHRVCLTKVKQLTKQNTEFVASELVTNQRAEFLPL